MGILNTENAIIPLLRSLNDEGRWKTPDDALVKTVIPFFHEAVDFLPLRLMDVQRHWWIADHHNISMIFKEVKGSVSNKGVDLPWLDLEQSLIIAENRIAGDDIAIALDFRLDKTNPRVVATNWYAGDAHGCDWEEVSPTFGDFVKRLGL